MLFLLGGCASPDSSRQTPIVQQPSARTVVAPPTSGPELEVASKEGTMRGTVRAIGKRLVLDTANHAIYSLTGATAATRPYVGKIVDIEGHVDHKSKVIHVHQIRAL